VVGKRTALVIRKPELFRRDQDAVDIGLLYQEARNSIIQSVRYLDAVGRRLIEKKDSLGHGRWLPWLRTYQDDLGFGERAAQWLMDGARWLASNPKLASDLDEVTALQISRRFWGKGKVFGALGAGDNEWLTPVRYVTLARAALGSIDLDPASTEKANEIVKAARIFTKEDDGLKQEWHGRVWLNPPYSQPLITQFISKMVTEYKAGRVTASVVLTHNYTDTNWFHEGVSAANAICFTLGRVPFHNANGKVANPTQGQLFLYFGDEVEAFYVEFGRIGFVIRL
jgi:phage N-6-adenine-methyltransferase